MARHMRVMKASDTQRLSDLLLSPATWPMVSLVWTEADDAVFTEMGRIEVPEAAVAGVRLLRRTFAELLPEETIGPLIVLATDEPDARGLICASERHDEIAIMWQCAQEPVRSLWYIAHEATELYVREALGSPPRWFYEGFAQWMANEVAGRFDAVGASRVAEQYGGRSRVSVSDIVDWRTPPAPRDALGTVTAEEGAAVADAFEEWATGAHTTDIERALYGAVLRLFVKTECFGRPPQRLLEDARAFRPGDYRHLLRDLSGIEI